MTAPSPFVAFRRVTSDLHADDQTTADQQAGIALCDRDNTIQYLTKSEGIADETIIELLTVLGLQELPDQHLSPQEFAAVKTATQHFNMASIST